MSLSSGSDITIPIQDSPPPPPSPYANRNGESGDKLTPEPLGDVTTGIENKGYQPNEGDSGKGKKNGEKSKGHTEINMTPVTVGNGDMKGNKAIEASTPNPESIDMSIMGTIPAKPQSEFGPYEQMDDYFIPVNQHKKFLSRRSEKLYVTKDKRKATNWKRYLCWTFGIFFIAAIIAVAILAAVGVISLPNKSGEGTFEQIFVTSTIGPLVIGDNSPPDPTNLHSTTKTPMSIDPENNYVPMAADVNFHIQNRKFEAALANRSSETFQQLATEVETKMKELFKERLHFDETVVKIHEFSPGSVYVKLLVGWKEDTMDFESIQMNLANVTQVGDFEIKQIRCFKVANFCKFNNNNGCSHSCSYDYELLEFICKCPETMTLKDDKKVCVSAFTPVTSSTEEPAPEPETPSESETPSAEPEPETSPEESTDAPVVSSSTAPDVDESIPVVTPSSTTTTAEPRSENIDIISEDIAQTTMSSQDDEENQPTVNNEATPSSTTTTTTTETPVIVPESETKDNVEDIETTKAPEESATEAPANDDEILDHSDGSDAQGQISLTVSSPAPIPETTTEKTEDKSEEQNSEIVTEESTSAVRENLEAAPITPVEVLDVSTTTSSTTTTAAPAVHEIPSLEEESMNSNLQRESDEKFSNSGESSSELDANPTSAAIPLNENVPSSNNSSSSERIGRQESFSELEASKPLSSSDETDSTTVIPTGQNEPVIPNSGEFMVFSDNQPAHSSSQQQTSTEAAVSKEKVGSGSEETGSIGSSASIEDTGAAEVQVEQEAIEATAPPPRTFLGDTDVNHLDNVTEDTVNSEQVHGSNNTTIVDGRDLGAIGDDDILGGATETPLTSSEEQDEVEPNRDHLTKEEVDTDTTVGPVVLDVNDSFDVDAVTTLAPTEHSTSTIAPIRIAPIVSSTSTTKPSNSSNSGESGQETDNELR